MSVIVGAVQAISTITLVGVTAFYAVATFNISNSTDDQAEATLGQAMATQELANIMAQQFSPTVVVANVDATHEGSNRWTLEFDLTNSGPETAGRVRVLFCMGTQSDEGEVVILERYKGARSLTLAPGATDKIRVRNAVIPTEITPLPFALVDYLDTADTRFATSVALSIEATPEPEPALRFSVEDQDFQGRGDCQRQE